MDLLTAPELAELLRVHQSTLSRWRTGGNGPAWILVGDQVRYRRDDVESWLTGNRRGEVRDATS